MFVKSIATFPAFARSEVLSYFNWPSGLAARLSALEEGAGATAVDSVVVAVVAGAVAAGVAEELVPFEPPQPASARMAPARASSETIGTRRACA